MGKNDFYACVCRDFYCSLIPADIKIINAHQESPYTPYQLMFFNLVLLLIPKNYSIPLCIFKERLVVSFHHLSLLSIGRSLLSDVREEKSLQLTTNFFKITSGSKLDPVCVRSKSTCR